MRGIIKFRFLKRYSVAGFSITEVMLAMTVGSLMMGGLMAGSTALRRTFDASDQQSKAEADANRLIDYVARDLRCATTVNTAANGSVLLTLTKNDYYDRRGTPNDASDDIPNTPTLGRYSATYGGNPMTIRYLQSGSRICREVAQIDGGATTTTTAWIADNINNFSVSLDAQKIATVTATFATRYRTRVGDPQAPTTALTRKINPRNPRS